MKLIQNKNYITFIFLFKKYFNSKEKFICQDIHEIILKPIFFHVMVQGINRSYIFDKGEDIRYYISVMYKLKEEHKINIIAYCIMNNHPHILLKAEETEELSKYMKRLNIKYAMYYNKKYNRVGYVFRNRFKSEGIYNEVQLYNCIKYIYDNPVKANICKKASDYPYSNYKEIKTNQEYVYYDFIDADQNLEEKCSDIIQKFLQNNNLEIIEIKNNKIKLKELIKLLKNQYNISFRNISKCLNLNREKIRKIYIE